MTNSDKKPTKDMRDWLLEVAGHCFQYKHVKVYGVEHWGDDAVKLGFDIIDIVHIFDRKFED